MTENNHGCTKNLLLGYKDEVHIDRCSHMLTSVPIPPYLIWVVNLKLHCPAQPTVKLSNKVLEGLCGLAQTLQLHIPMQIIYPDWWNDMMVHLILGMVTDI